MRVLPIYIQWISILFVIGMLSYFSATRTFYYESIENGGETFNKSSTFMGHAQQQNVINIAIVICSKPGDNGPREEVAVLIKSVVISSIFYKITNPIEFHLFIEHVQDQEFFNSTLKDYQHPECFAAISVYFHSAKHVLRNYYHENMAGEERLRCMYLRIFFPSVLENIDSVIYMDTDIIVTGNIWDLWNHFSKMSGEQLVGLVPDFEPKNTLSSNLLKEVPYPPPKGVNSGVQLMNLTRMRAYRWEEKLLRLYGDYAIRQHVRMRSDQKLLNIFLYFDSGLLLEIPCHFNFWWTHCSGGLYCDGALHDPIGIQIIHGAASGFDKEKPFHEIFIKFRDFKLEANTSTSAIINELMLPIKMEYEPGGSQLTNRQRRMKRFHKLCDGSIDKILFKNHFST